jgi:DinB family protein
MNSTSIEMRRQKIESYGAAHATLVAALERFPQDMWQFRPAPDRWTIHEIIVHITDSEANSYVRCRRLLAEPGSTVMGYDEWTWASALDYHAQSTAEAVELFKWLRRKSYTLIRDQPESVWANTVHHTESGLMTMDEWLDIYNRHIPDHIQQMQAVYDDWQAGRRA